MLIALARCLCRCLEDSAHAVFNLHFSMVLPGYSASTGIGQPGKFGGGIDQANNPHVGVRILTKLVDYCELKVWQITRS